MTTSNLPTKDELELQMQERIAVLEKKNKVLQAEILECKRAEEILHAGEERLRLLSDGLPDSALYQYTHELDGSVRFLYCSAGIERLNGVSPLDVLRDPGTLHRQIPPEYFKRLIEAEERSALELSDFDMETPMQRPDGQIRWMRLHSHPRRLPDGRTLWDGVQTDITEHKKTEEAFKKAYTRLEEKVKERTTELENAYKSLKENERRLSEAQKMAHLGNWDRDFSTDEIYWSDEAYRIFGYHPQKLKITYSMFLGHIHPDDRDCVINAIKKSLDGEPYSIDFRIIAANGIERVVHSQGEIVFNENNIPVRMRGTVQDITERKKAEERIRSLANIVESSNDAIVTESLDGIITSWNKGAERIYGYSAEEILGKPISLLEPSLLNRETKELVEKIKQGEVVEQYETLRLKKDGIIIDVSIILSPVFDIYGKLAAVSVFYRDITERKRAEEKLRESEEKYRNIAETANEGILIINDKAVITYANRKITDMLGYTLEEGIGRPIWDFISEESKDFARLNLERRQQGINGSYELKAISKDGLPLWMHINAKSLFDKDGKFIGSLSMLTDITKRKEAERALENIEIARQKEIHHRIKNNLQVISSLLDLEAEKFSNKENVQNSEVLEAFKESRNRVISIALIHEELHEEAGRTLDTLNFPLYLRRLVENLFQTYRIGDTNICLNLDLEENIFFDMDIAVPLGIIVNELVSNSLKYAFPQRKRGEIQIKLQRKEAKDKENAEEELNGKGTGYTLAVSDNGAGVPENIDFESSKKLGLQLVNILVDQLEGEIELKRDNGTEFIIIFNVKEKQN